MRQCRLQREGDGVRCLGCGRRQSSFAQQFCDPAAPGRPVSIEHWRPSQRVDLPWWWRWGACVTRALSWVGLTKARWQWIKAQLGLPAKCSCSIWEARLNAIALRARRDQAEAWSAWALCGTCSRTHSASSSSCAS